MRVEKVSLRIWLLFGLFSFGVVFLLPATVALSWQIHSSFSAIKQLKRWWEGDVHAVDPRVGYTLVKNGSGDVVYRGIMNIPVTIDERGLRKGFTSNLTGERIPRVLFLGCSYTFGMGVADTDTFAYQSGKSLNYETFNGGVSGYGLASMVLRARRLIPELRPDIVIVQYSPWLVTRSSTHFSVTNRLFRSPVPFFDKDGVIHKPVYTGIGPGMKPTQYARDSLGFFDFYWRVGLPLFLHQNLQESLLLFRKAIGLVPPPGDNKEEIIKVAYDELASLAHAVDADMFILLLSRGAHAEEAVLFPTDVLIDAESHLIGHVKEQVGAIDAKSYLSVLGIQSPQSGRVIDSHPNVLAHRLIADVVVSKLRDETS